MSNEETLKEQIKCLEKLLELKDKVIAELEKKTYITYVSFPDCQHEYPNPWYGTIAPNCKKCGRQQTNWFTITSSTSDSTVYTLRNHG